MKIQVAKSVQQTIRVMNEGQRIFTRKELLSCFERDGEAIPFLLPRTDSDENLSFRLDKRLELTGSTYELHDQLDFVTAAIAAKYPDDPVIHFSSTPLMFSDHWHEMSNSEEPWKVQVSHRPDSNELTLRRRVMLWIKFRKNVFWIEATNPPLQMAILRDRLNKFHATDVSEKLRQVRARIDRIRCLQKEIENGEWPRLLIVELPNILPSDYPSYCCSRRFSQSVRRIIGRDASPIHFVYHPDSLPYTRQTFNSHWDALIESGNLQKENRGWPSDITKPDDILTRTEECAAFNLTQLRSFERFLLDLKRSIKQCVASGSSERQDENYHRGPYKIKLRDWDANLPVKLIPVMRPSAEVVFRDEPARILTMLASRGTMLGTDANKKETVIEFKDICAASDPRALDEIRRKASDNKEFEKLVRRIAHKRMEMLRNVLESRGFKPSEVFESKRAQGFLLIAEIECLDSSALDVLRKRSQDPDVPGYS